MKKLYISLLLVGLNNLTLQAPKHRASKSIEELQTKLTKVRQENAENLQAYQEALQQSEARKLQLNKLEQSAQRRKTVLLGQFFPALSDSTK